jgi:pSer/pThr/pTyr-binding forkhead associated (FHA) protein/DNA-binding CsgD family transcriptional regulator
MAEQPGYTTSPVELRERLAAERRGNPFLVYRDERGAQRIVDLQDSTERMSIGRSPRAVIPLTWDADASGVHAELQRVVDVWTVVDDGLSRNGTFVNGERIQGRRRLADGDVLRCGTTAIVYRAPGEATRAATAATEFETPQISEAQKRVLIALARPFGEGNTFATAASNPQIAQELYLSVHAVKTHLRALFTKFGVENLPQNQKRARLVALAIQSGQITERDLQQIQR